MRRTGDHLHERLQVLLVGDDPDGARFFRDHLERSRIEADVNWKPVPPDQLEELGEAAASILVAALSPSVDNGGVQVIARNLLSNAIKYTEEGRVTVRVYYDDEAAVLEVEDTGIGMEPGRAETLFEPFRQASEGMSRAYEGTGVGLAVTKKAAEQMGGSVAVNTEKGTGSRFVVRLPRAEASEGEE